jgi:hypothetical protein
MQSKTGYLVRNHPGVSVGSMVIFDLKLRAGLETALPPQPQDIALIS